MIYLKRYEMMSWLKDYRRIKRIGCVRIVLLHGCFLVKKYWNQTTQFIPAYGFDPSIMTCC